MKAIFLLVSALILLSACTKTDPATASLEKKFPLPIGIGGRNHPSPPRKPTAESSLYLTGDQNEELLEGHTISVNAAQFTISTTTDKGRLFVTFSFKGEHTVAVTLSSALNQQLPIGTYDYVRDVGHEFPGHAGLTITLDGKTTANVNARFQIFELAHDAGGTITTFAADFQVKDGRASGNLVGLNGALRLNSQRPVPPAIDVPANPDSNNRLPSLINVAGQNASGVTERHGDFALSNVFSGGSEILTLQFAENFPGLGDGLFTYTASPSLVLGVEPSPAAKLTMDLGQCDGTIKNLNVLELERDANQILTKFSANYDLACDNGSPMQKGYLRYHSILAL